MKVVARGRFERVVASDGSEIDVTLFGCDVVQAPYVRNGKTYMVVSTESAAGGLDTLRAVHDLIRRRAAIRFTPLLGHRLTVKIAKAMAYRDAAGDVTSTWQPGVGDVVDVALRPGAFGEFGYCWLLSAVKPSAAA